VPFPSYERALFYPVPQKNQAVKIRAAATRDPAASGHDLAGPGPGDRRVDVPRKAIEKRHMKSAHRRYEHYETNFCIVGSLLARGQQ